VRSGLKINQTRTYFIKLCYRSPRRMNACQSPTTACPAPGPLAEGRAITRWMGYLARSACACRDVWSTAVMLPQQLCSRSGTWHAVDPTGQVDARYARYDHSVGQESLPKPGVTKTHVVPVQQGDRCDTRRWVRKSAFRTPNHSTHPSWRIRWMEDIASTSLAGVPNTGNAV